MCVGVTGLHGRRPGGGLDSGLARRGVIVAFHGVIVAFHGDTGPALEGGVLLFTVHEEIRRAKQMGRQADRETTSQHLG